MLGWFATLEANGIHRDRPTMVKIRPLPSVEILYQATPQLESALADICGAPQDQGVLEMVVLRPTKNQRSILPVAQLSPEGGLHGDRWAKGPNPDLENQVSLMSARVLRLIAGEPERMALAGDNLIVDFDLSAVNLSVGQRLAIGQVVLEITALPHTGCSKFKSRFGPDSLQFINAKSRANLYLRGRYARVLTPGTVQVGDIVQKVSSQEHLHD